MLTSRARAAVLYNRLGRVDCRGQGRPLLPGVRGLRMRRFVTRTQCSNTTQQDTRLWDGKGARHHPETYCTYSTTTGHVSVWATVHTALKHCQTRLILTCLESTECFALGHRWHFGTTNPTKNINHFFSKSFVRLRFILTPSFNTWRSPSTLYYKV